MIKSLPIRTLKMIEAEFDAHVVKYFTALIENDTSLSSGIAAIKTLLMVLENTKFDTIHILISTIQAAVLAMRSSELPITAIVSGSELFSRFITFAKFDDKSMEECKNIMLNRGKSFLSKLLECRQIVSNQAAQFITDGCRVLTHSRSRVVLQTLEVAAKSNKKFHVYVTEGGHDKDGKQMCSDLEKFGIDCTLIMDSAIGYVMESVDFVMVGAEGVVESGGIINRIGTFTMSVCAKEMKKPVYVVAESFKFTRLYPLNQRDLPDEYKYSKQDLRNMKNIGKAHPLVDYTPPAYITLIFSDLGILTPSAVSDELIKLYL